jgi:hypothetical protein
MVLERGVSAKVASKAFGHANPTITQRLYQHVLGGLPAQAINEIDRALRPTGAAKRRAYVPNMATSLATCLVG